MTASNASVPTFGSQLPEVHYEDRVAAYAVIRGHAGAVAAVRAPAGYWLPGGGTEAGETAEEGLLREAVEEFGREIRIVGVMGEAVQYFFANAEGTHYRMRAMFFEAQLSTEPIGTAEYELCWLDVSGPERLFFHACHDWAARL